MKLFHMEKQEQMVGADPFVRVPSTFTRVYSKQMLNAMKLLKNTGADLVKLKSSLR